MPFWGDLALPEKDAHRRHGDHHREAATPGSPSEDTSIITYHVLEHILIATTNADYLNQLK